MLHSKPQTAAHAPQGEKPSTTRKDGKLSYEELVLGVWRVLIAKDTSFSLFNFDIQWDSLSVRAALLRRVLFDVYTISPRLFALSIMTHAWFAINRPLSLYFSNRLFYFVEKQVSGSLSSDETLFDLYVAMISRISCSALSAYIRQASQQVATAYSSRVKYEFQARIFSAKLAWDLQTAQEQGESKVNVEDIYRCLNRGISLVNTAVSFLLHLRLMIHVIGAGHKDGGLVFVAICMLPFLVEQFTAGDLWMKCFVAYPVNQFYIRKSALGKLDQLGLKQEVMAGGVSDFLIKEYRKAKDGLGYMPDTGPESLYMQGRQTLSEIMATLCSDAPMFYFALLALFVPSKLSLVQLAILNESSTSLQGTFLGIRYAISAWPSEFSRMRNVYAVLDTRSKMKDGETPFPRPGYEASTGMGIEVQDVSFSYPSTKSEHAALANVSFTIKPGQLVVIVGANGSGKSTIIKLFSRLYDVTSGKILIDGIPIEAYRMDTLRSGIGMLTQEHQLLPLSVGENIQLGAPESEAKHDEQTVRSAASAAGAEGVVARFVGGYDTVLEPVARGYLSAAGRGNKELEAMKEQLEKPTNISGGEKQKLVAARTFMRLFTTPVKLVTVDEPSSALDPDAEYRLFTNLRQERAGRTMIFVTHRFGHLTKHADQIICMKEGAVVETGTHADLLAKGGEYAHLYGVQAQAFATA